MSGNCDCCSPFECDCTAPEYINDEGHFAVLCPACETEIIMVGETPCKIVCSECETIIEVLPILLN